jgi:transcriptional regulator with XRE-family HTH domain
MLIFWKRVTELISLQNTTQSWIAEKSNILHQTLSQWILKDRLPDVEKGIKIAEILGVTAEFLVTGKPPEGISEEALQIARAVDRLSSAGKKAALSMVEGLAKDYPQKPGTAANTAG